jgi:hypothetical protein
MNASKIASIIAAAAMFCAGTALAGGVAKRPVVVELYTSQGCSSCPPADMLLGQLAARPDVLAMSLPITYWDMLGWKDTLASEENTRRQKAYAAALGKGAVYTPQIIVDGVTDVVGSRENSVKDDIVARLADMSAVPVSLNAMPGQVHVVVGAGGKPGADATIWVFHILSQATVNIGDGENDGRKITYHNVVRDLKAVGMWKGDAVSLDLPRHDPSDPPHDGLAIVVQQAGYGRVIGAAFITKPDYYAAR